MVDEYYKKVFLFSKQLNKLKYIHRYKSTSCKDKDSTASHSWHITILAMLYHNKLDISLDIEKCMKMALIHDIPEIITDDFDNKLVRDNIISYKEKNDLEVDAMNKLTNILPSDLKNEILELWDEYEEGNTKEACYIKALDKIEALHNILERGDSSFDFTDISIQYADKAVKKIPVLKPLLFNVKKEFKKKFLELGLEWNNEYDYALID